MTTEESKPKIESYGRAHENLVAALKEFPQEMWSWKPPPDRWSIHELLIHIADSEANGYGRCRRFLAEPGESVMAYDQDKWTERLQYHEQYTGDALELFQLLRLMSFRLITGLPEEVWKNTVEHPEYGTVTFDQWLDIYERHIPGHIEQMRGNLSAWKESQGK